MLQDSRAFSGFSVADITAARQFYGTTLGLKVSQDDRGLTLHLAGGTDVFIYPAPDHTPALFTIMNFPVSDIDRAVEQLVAAGVTMERYELGFAQQDGKDILRGKAAGRGPDIAWFKDPAGNILSVLSA